MMKRLSPQLLASMVVACVSALAAPAAMAQFQFTGAGSGSTCDTGTNAVDSFQCTKTVGANSVTATLSTWGFTGATLSSSAAGTGFQQGRLADHDGYGFGAYTGNKETTAGSNHAFDDLTSGCGTTSTSVSGSVALSTANNGCGGSIEGLLLNFGSTKVNLSNVGLGYANGNADLMVWAYTGNNFNIGATTAISGASAALSGWQLVSSNDFGSANGGPLSVNQATQNSSVYSSYFLITTYFGANTGGFSAFDSAFKINSFTVNTCASTLSGGSSGGTGGANNGNGASCSTPSNVPEPGSLALVGVAMLGVTASRRRIFGRR